jgi:hypothetical protein
MNLPGPALLMQALLTTHSTGCRFGAIVLEISIKHFLSAEFSDPSVCI